MRVRKRLETASGFTICDGRHLPIVVARWFGTLDVGLVDEFDQWIGELLDGLDAEDLQAAMVVDITGAEPPSSEVRRALVAMRSARLPRTRARLVADLVVIDRPAVRAVISTLHWIAPQLQATPVASLDEGLRRAHEELTRMGITAPRLGAIEFEEPGW